VFTRRRVAGEFRKANLNTDYVFPKMRPNPRARGIKAPELFHSTSDYGFVQYVAHGDPPYLRIEAGHTGKDLKNYLATGAEYRKQLDFKAPTIVYVIGCNVGTVNANFRSNEEYCRPRPFHAGTIAYVRPTSASRSASGVTRRRPGADQAILFWTTSS